MITLASTEDVLRALRRAREVTCASYALPSGPVLDGLASAARRGAHVVVRLEGTPYKDAAGGLQRANAAAVAALRSAGADARLLHGAPGEAALHAKAIVADDALYLDDCNWPHDGCDTIVRDDAPSHVRMVRDITLGQAVAASRGFATGKRAALASEARTIAAASRDCVDIESESVSAYNCAFTAIDARAERGERVRLLVSARDLRGNAKERAALSKLANDGVQVRTCPASEKFALAGARAWIGSANASAAFDKPDQTDWGLQTRAKQVIVHLRSHFDQRWIKATPLRTI